MLQTLRQLFRPSEIQIQAQNAYLTCTAQARNPVFYSTFGVPDTLDGRYEMIVLHLWLQLTRWGNTVNDEQKRAIIEAFFQDMDQNLREFGIDMGIKKRMRAMADGYYGRLTAYDAAIAMHENDALEAALTRNIYGTCVNPPVRTHIDSLTRYVRNALQPALTSEWPELS